MIRYLLFLMLMHPLHLATIHIYTDKNDELKATVKVFKDDLENAIYHSYNQSFETDELNKKNKLLAAKYINDHFFIRSDSVKINLIVDSIEVQNDVTIFRFSIPCKIENNMVLGCDIFNELFNDQTNLIMIKLGTFEKGYRLNNRQNKIEISFE
jgi:hypothetical protein